MQSDRNNCVINARIYIYQTHSSRIVSLFHHHCLSRFSTRIHFLCFNYCAVRSRTRMYVRLQEKKIGGVTRNSTGKRDRKKISTERATDADNEAAGNSINETRQLVILPFFQFQPLRLTGQANFCEIRLHTVY